MSCGLRSWFAKKEFSLDARPGGGGGNALVAERLGSDQTEISVF